MNSQDEPRRRPYRSELRAERAASTRRRLLAAAGECFAEFGYAGTSLRAIAGRAGISVETVQQSGPKADLLLASFEQSFAGKEGRLSLLQREGVEPILRMTDPEEFITAMVDFMVPANIESAALAASIEAAARSDPRIAEVLAGLGERARADARTAIALLAAQGAVTSGRPIAEVGDELWFVMKQTHYLALVEEAGWSARCCGRRQPGWVDAPVRPR